jgi:Na+-driven multidrug efflux pump
MGEWEESLAASARAVQLRPMRNNGTGSAAAGWSNVNFTALFDWFQDSEMGPVLRLALPVILSNGLQYLLQVVDAAFLGHLGPTELAAAALGNAYFNMVRTCMN